MAMHPPVKPIYSIHPPSHTRPPINAPAPIPRLKIPEYILMATAELWGENTIISF